MPGEDARRWNTRYQNGFIGAEPLPRAILQRAQPYLRNDGLVLDLAMGLGVNARWLNERGFRVVGLDISSEAVFHAKESCPQLMVFLADLNEYPLPAKSFSTILNFYFLKRDLILDFPRIIQPGGIAIVETLTAEMLQIRPEMPVENLLRSGELPSLFPGWEILHYQEGWQISDHGGKKAVASLIAKFPG